MNAGFEYQLKGNQTLTRQLHAQQPAPDDRGSRRARKRQRGLQVRQPRRGHRGDDGAVGPDDGVCDAQAEAAVRRARSRRGRSASRTTGSAAPATSTAGCTATTRVSSNSDEISTPTTGRSSGTAQQQAGSIARPGSSANRAWDLDELVWDSHGNLDVLGRLATDRPHAVKLYGSYMLPTQTQVGAFFYGASGTPVSTTVSSLNGIPLFVEGRGSFGRTPMLTQTDLLVSHDLKFGGSKRMRLEANVINVFNQKTARHVFDSLNRPRRASSAINLADTDLAAGLRLQRAAGRPAGWRQLEGPALRDGRPVQPRAAGAVQRAVPVLTRVGWVRSGSVGLGRLVGLGWLLTRDPLNPATSPTRPRDPTRPNLTNRPTSARPTPRLAPDTSRPLSRDEPLCLRGQTTDPTIRIAVRQIQDSARP